MNIITYTLILIARYILGAIANGFVLTFLWKWFVSASFSLPNIDIPTAIGLSLVVNFIVIKNFPPTKDYDGKSKKEIIKDVLKTAVGPVILKPLIAFLIGFVITLFL